MRPGALAQALGDLLFPPRCAVCRRGADGQLCPSCLREFRLISPPFCAKCGRPAQAQVSPVVVPSCAYRCGTLHFVRARAVAIYEGAVREAIHALKFRGRRRLAAPLGELMADVAVRDEILRRSRAVVPVPLHPSRLRARGFNQAALLARPIALRLGIPLAPASLRRVTDVPPQSRLSAHDRKVNVAGSFSVGEAVPGIPVLLVDDVLSTGSTASECARVLMAGGASSVAVLTLAAAVLLESGSERVVKGG